MKIVCENCGAKYRIADDKVQGKTFKLRCKRCEEVIRVEGDGASESGSGAASGFGEDYGGDSSVEWYAVIDGDRAGPITSDEVAAYVGEGVLDGESYVWRSGLDDWKPLRDVDSLSHLVGGGGSGDEEPTADPAAESGYEQTRVMDPSQTGALSADESDASDTVENPDWDETTEEMPPSEDDAPGVQEADPEVLEPEESVQEVGDATSEHDGMFAGVSDPDETASGGSKSGASQVSGVWSSSSGTFESFDDDGASSKEPASDGGSGAALDDNMVDQRNENSVLFSLDGVEEMNAVDEESDEPEAAGAGAATEGSGLIDIQSLAATHAAMSSEDEESGGGSKGAAPAAQASGSGQVNNMPNLAPSGSRSNNTGLIVAIIVGALILAAAGIGALYVMTRDGEPQRVQRVAEAQKGSGQAGSGTQKDQGAAAGADDSDRDEKAAVATGGDAGTADGGAAVAQAGTDTGEDKESDDQEDEKTAEAEREEQADPSPQEADPEPTRTARRRESSGGGSAGGSDDDLDELLGNVGKGSGGSGSGSSSGGSAGTSADQESEPAEDLPEKPSRSMVMDTIRKYSGRVNNCGQKSNKESLSGTCKVKFTVEPSGQTSGVSIQSSDFKGTDVGNCVRGVVQSMSFPKTQKGMPVLFPFSVK